VVFLLTRKSTFFRKYFYLRVITRNYAQVLVSNYLRKNVPHKFEKLHKICAKMLNSPFLNLNINLGL
jgi:hypothetical protein